jgi:hypothetical protein
MGNLNFWPFNGKSLKNSGSLGHTLDKVATDAAIITSDFGISEANSLVGTKVLQPENREASTPFARGLAKDLGVYGGISGKVAGLVLNSLTGGLSGLGLQGVKVAADATGDFGANKKAKTDVPIVDTYNPSLNGDHKAQSVMSGVANIPLPVEKQKDNTVNYQKAGDQGITFDEKGSPTFKTTGTVASEPVTLGSFLKANYVYISLAFTALGTVLYFVFNRKKRGR